MLKKIGKACISVVVAFCLALAIWYFLLVKLPEDVLVQGTAAPVMSKKEALSLLNFHGVRVAYIKDGEWKFSRDGHTCSLIKKK